MFIKTKIKKISLFLIVFAAVFVPVAMSDNIKPQAAPTVADLQKQINDKKASINSSANKRKELEAKISQLKNQQADAMRDKKNYDDLIATIEAEIKDTEELMEMLGEFIVQEEAEIQKTQEEYEKSYGVFLEMIKFAYEEGDVNYLNLLLKAENFTDFLTKMDIISNIAEYNKNVTDRLLQSKENLESVKENHEEMIKQLEEYKEDLEKSSKEASGFRAQAISIVEQTKKEIEANIARQAELEKQEADIQAEILRRSKELQALQDSQRKYVGGTLMWPVDTKYGKISSGFGNRNSPITGRYEFHSGIDIPAAYGASIYAANDGTVIISGTSGGYGNYVVIDHGGGKTTMYAHNSANLAKAGDKVKKGDVIAKIGSTGWSTGNHIHFAYAEDGVFKSPLSNGLNKP